MTKSERSAVLSSLISSLKQQRDELALQMHLGKTEAKEEWDKVDKKWRQLTAEYEPLKDAVGETTDNVISGVRLIADEVKQGFERVAKLLRES
jgi:hypothetical protein